MKKTVDQDKQQDRRGWWKIPAIALALAVLSSFPYAQTKDHDFISYDDPVYVTENAEVRSGLSVAGVRWAFSALHAANWHPVTWMSHMLDVSLFGMDAGRHHLVNVVLHVLSTALLFLALFRMTGAVWRSAFVAALFGVHPLHVESVAWIAERKDVLSGFFFMLVLLSYERYVRRGSAGPYLLTLLFFTLGLLSKQMLVTVPCLLLLLDVWPLGRTGWARPADGSTGHPLRWSRLVREKIPLMVLAVAASAATVVAQKQGGAMSLMARELVPLPDRLANASIAYAVYLGKMLWPASLSVFYPHPGTKVSWPLAAGCLVLLIASVILVVRQRRQRPFLFVGWFWYLGMLVPVIGIVQVGIQAYADRYTYLPLIGPFIGLAWSAGDALSGLRERRGQASALAAGAVLCVLTATTFVQAGHWRDSVSLFQHAVTVMPENWLASRALGKALADAGRPEEAIAMYREALRLRPRDAKSHNDLAVELAGQGRHQEAVEQYREAIRLHPDIAEFHNNLGNAFAMTGRRSEAVEEYRRAMDLRPGWIVPRENLDLLPAQKTAPDPRASAAKSRGNQPH